MAAPFSILLKDKDKKLTIIVFDDFVLVVNEAVPRSQWSTARVLETYPDARGDVRSVMVKRHVQF